MLGRAPKLLSLSLAVALWTLPAVARAQEKAEPAKDEQGQKAEGQSGDEEATPDAAKDEAKGSAERPWNRGVPLEQRDKAQRFFEQGNEQFAHSSYAKALVEYRKAIVLWDHPAIRYNLAIALMHLDQPIEALEHLESSLQYGPDPLGQRLFSEGGLHVKNLRARLSVLRVSTREANAVVTIDGEELFTGPGEVVKTVLSKRHQIVASKEGMQTLTQAIAPEAGKELTVSLRLLPLGGDVVLTRRWARWKPWAVVGGAVVSGALAGSFYVLANRNIDSFDRGIAAVCPTGCPTSGPDSEEYRALEKQEDTAKLQNELMVASIAVGTVALGTGLVMLYLNRPLPQRIHSSLGASDESSVSVAPLWEDGHGGILTRFHLVF